LYVPVTGNCARARARPAAPAADAPRPPHSAASVRRFWLVQRHGGVYTDVDVEAFAAVAAWAPRPECAVHLMLERCRAGPRFGQYEFAAAARHPLFTAVVRELERKVRVGNYCIGDAAHGGVLAFAGPIFFDAAVAEYLNSRAAELGITPYPGPTRDKARHRWLSKNDAALRAHGICVHTHDQMVPFLHHWPTSLHAEQQSRAHGGSWREQDVALAARQRGR
jgi:hypothetical protein